MTSKKSIATSHITTSSDYKKSMSEKEIWRIVSFIMSKGITIYPLPKDNSKGEFRPECYIHVNNNGKITKSPKTYRQDRHLYEKIKELYVWYYGKIT